MIRLCRPRIRSAAGGNPSAAPADGSAVRSAAEELTDEQIGQAIKRGVDFLWREFGNGTSVAGGRGASVSDQYPGINALCVYALLQCGQAINDERLNVRSNRMRAIITTMRDMPPGDSYATYIRGIRASALAVYNRPEDHAALKEDVNWLVANNQPRRLQLHRLLHAHWQLGQFQLAIRAAGGVVGGGSGIEVPATYWNEVQTHWLDCQNAGRLGYQRAGARARSRCLRGTRIAVRDPRLSGRPVAGTAIGRQPFSKPLERGLAWMETGDNCIT